MELRNKAHIVFIHPLGGVPEQLKHHIQFLKEAGFAVSAGSYFLSGAMKWKTFLKLTKNLKTSVLEIWLKELENHLNTLTAGPKVLFGFSLPSAVAFMAVSQRTDIKAIICDGGPFFQILRVSWNYLAYYQKISNFFLKIYLAGKMGQAFGVFSLKKKLKKAFLKLPPDFPVLSFQGLKDQQVPPAFIAKTLEQAPRIRVNTCRLETADHLEGFKKQKDFYSRQVLNFLNQLNF